MKYCPTCETRYEEEIIRFCTKDGTPLLEEKQPNFTEMPSESFQVEQDDIGEETVIRRNRPQNVPPPISDEKNTASERIIIPTTEKIRSADVRPKVVAPTMPRKSNTIAVVLFTMLGTLAVLALGWLGWTFFGKKEDRAINVNINSNINSVLTNQNTNVNNDNANLFPNYNFNTNFNSNTNSNANLRTPTPTRTPTPKPTPTKTPTPQANVNVNAVSNVANTNVVAPLPSVTPTPVKTPTPAVPANVNVGVLNPRAISLPKPAYPPAARQMNAAGQVSVQVSLDEEGNVLSAKAVSGHNLLRAPAENAARQSKFNPVRVGGKAVRATGVILYNFINQ